MDNVTGLPGSEITQENIVLVPGRFGWRTHDISRYKINVPDNGIVVAFEMYDAGQQYYFMYTYTMKDGSKKTTKNYGWLLRGIREGEIIGFTRTPGSRWQILKLSNKKSAAPQVSLTFKVCKT
jgi:hypothetical protein